MGGELLLRGAWEPSLIPGETSGFEVHDGRLGALIMRLESCKDRLLAYANGEIEKLEELENEILPFLNAKPGEPIPYNCYGRIVTANQFTHAL